MNDLFLITVPGNPVEKFVTDDISYWTCKFQLFLIEKIAFKSCKSCVETPETANS